jgi:uncharacterized protein (TIGR02466 family)
VNTPPSLRALFATPLLVEPFADFEAVNPVLEQLILKRRAHDAGIVRTNQGGWHSDVDLLRWAADAVRPVVQQIVERCDAMTNDLQAKPGQRRGWLLEAWANVNTPGGAANIAHHHGGSYWSAVYYVRVDPGTGGELVLRDPRGAAIDMHAPALRMRGIDGEQIEAIKPTAGMIVIMPSWLVHEVLPWQGQGLRISIAVNLSAGRLG